LDTWKELSQKSAEPENTLTAAAEAMLSKNEKTQADEKRAAEEAILEAHADVLEVRRRKVMQDMQY
jgi:hypothetical protein